MRSTRCETRQLLQAKNAEGTTTNFAGHTQVTATTHSQMYADHNWQTGAAEDSLLA